MKRPSTTEIKNFIRSRFVLEDDVGEFIPGTETERLMRDLMQSFDGIYCGTLPNKGGGKTFIVRSAKTGRYFAEFRVK